MEVLDPTPEVVGHSKFKYSDSWINPRTAIRILNLLPPKDSTTKDLHCTLSVAKLEDKPSYEAISYVWGPPEFPERLYLPSGYLAITSSLAAALRQLRYPDRPRHLWVDAVCINQSDDIEKGHQVELMSQIYRHTSCALAWLGPDNSVGLFDHLEKLADIHRDVGVNRACNFTDILEMRATAPMNYMYQLPLAAQLIMQGYSNSNIWSLLDLPWFERLWILQEAILPRRILLCWGSETLDMDQFVLSLKVYLRIEPPEPTDISQDKWLEIMSLIDLREKFHKNLTSMTSHDKQRTNIGLYRLVSAFASHKACYNDMDRIFGLLGLQSHNDLRYEANYGGSVESVYFDFALRVIKRIGPELVLEESNRMFVDDQGVRHHMSVKLPSWVPDWRFPLSSNGLLSEEFESATGVPKCYNVENPPFLGIRGVRIDIITADLATILPHDDWAPTVRELCECFPNGLITVRDFVQRNIPSPWTKKLAHIGSEMTRKCANFFVHREIPPDTSPSTEVITKAFLGTIFSDRSSIPEGTSSTLSPFLAPGSKFWSLQSYYKWWLSFEHDTSIDIPGPCHQRDGNFVMTKTGHIGVGPMLANIGHIVVIFDSFKTPYVLRPILSDQPPRPPLYSPTKEQDFIPDEQWEIVGECYLHGFMNNEVISRKWRAKSEMFWIV